MGTVVKCPACGSMEFDLKHYDSILVLSSELALFSLHCPVCAMGVTSVCVIPPELMPEVSEVAARIGAGMGRHLPSR